MDSIIPKGVPGLENSYREEDSPAHCGTSAAAQAAFDQADNN